MIKCLVQY